MDSRLSLRHVPVQESTEVEADLRVVVRSVLPFKNHHHTPDTLPRG